MFQITLDGPSGSGKSTLAKALAKKMNITYLDTGAMYRALTYYCLQNSINIDDANAVIEGMTDFNLDISEEKISVNNEDVSLTIRKEYISKEVSKVASIKAVRDFMVAMQRSIARQKSIVMDGRDIGTVVLPDAKYKFYITASDEVRAKRRYNEQVSKGYDVDFKDIFNDMKRRDQIDSNRVHSPLKPAVDAQIIDTTYMTIEDIIKQIEERVKSAYENHCS